MVIGFFNQAQCDTSKELVSEIGVECELYVGRTVELMTLADACIACSGSVSLELMYHRLPTVIVYRISRLKHFLHRFFLRSRYITLVNLLNAPKISRDGIRTYRPDDENAESVPMPEFLDYRNRSEPIARQITEWLTNRPARNEVVQRLNDLAKEFAIPGASQRAADYIGQRIGIISESKAAA